MFANAAPSDVSHLAVVNGTTVLVLLALAAVVTLFVVQANCRVTGCNVVIEGEERADVVRRSREHYVVEHAEPRTACRPCARGAHAESPHPATDGAPCGCACAATERRYRDQPYDQDAHVDAPAGEVAA